MAVNQYDVGDTIRLRAYFTDTGDEPFDPSAVTFTIRTPSSTELSEQWVAASTTTTIVHPSSGEFTYDYLITAPGTFRYRAESTGLQLNTAAEHVFTVRRQWVGAST